MNSVPADPLIGRTLDERYVIRSRIARGGMAMVYLANDLRLERRVAVKVMHPHLVEDENFTRRFEQEARSSAALGHPNVVNVFDQGVDRGVPYLVMEYLPGITLRELLTQQQRLTAEQAVEIGAAVLSGLAAAHASGIVHRDLKPENVLLADDGRIKIGDFGLARAVSANTTTGQALLGTIAYLSPELVTRGVADARSDVYAFGIMLYEMLTGTQPFQGEQPMQIAYQHAHAEVPAPSALSEEATEDLDALVRWCTQRDPDDRPRDAGEALEHVRELLHPATGATRVLPRLLDERPTVTPSTTILSRVQQSRIAESAQPSVRAASHGSEESASDRAQRASRRRGRRGRWVAALSVLAVAAAGFGGWWFGQGPGSQVEVPEVAGMEIAAAQAALEAETFVVSVVECSSLDIPEGFASETAPPAGSRLDRRSAVELCQSTGPRSLPVPTLVGLPLDEATVAVEAAGFAVGEVLDRRFDDGTENAVIAALDDQGNGLGDTYLEQGRIDFIVSAGRIPAVDGQSPEAATETLERAGLTVDPSANLEEYDDRLPAGQVLGVVTLTDPVRVGDSVGLRISRGPELFAVPDVAGLNVNDAAATLRAAGFTVSTGLVPEGPAGALFEVKGTAPAAGELRPAGTEIALRYI